ncbi:hypothetical protein P7C73_g2563, partial [Tremellales sp. Uapishka_1]
MSDDETVNNRYSSHGTLPKNVQILNPLSHTVLPKGFHRDPFHDCILSTVHHHQLAIESSSSQPFVAIHPSFLSLLTPEATIRVISQDTKAFAHEAGVWVEQTEEVWFTSNLYHGSSSADKSVDVTRIHLESGRIDVVPLDEIKTANGACPYGDYLLVCDQGLGLEYPSQLILIDPVSPPYSCIAILNNFNGRAFNSLNDVIVLPPRGPTSVLPPSPPMTHSSLTSRIAPAGSTVWFTDPAYGYEQGYKRKPQLPSQVYCFVPQTGVVRAVADGFDHPNGIAFSPNGRVCYITDTAHIAGTGVLDASKSSTIYAFDVVWPEEGDLGNAGPTLQNRRLFAFADCVKCDTRGNVYSGCGDGLHIWNEYGTLIGKMQVIARSRDGNKGASCANFCFVPGGRIVCLSEDRIYLIEGLCVEGALL